MSMGQFDVKDNVMRLIDLNHGTIFPRNFAGFWLS